MPNLRRFPLSIVAARSSAIRHGKVAILVPGRVIPPFEVEGSRTNCVKGWHCFARRGSAGLDSLIVTSRRTIRSEKCVVTRGKEVLSSAESQNARVPGATC